MKASEISSIEALRPTTVPGTRQAVEYLTSSAESFATNLGDKNRQIGQIDPERFTLPVGNYTYDEAKSDFSQTADGQSHMAILAFKNDQTGEIHLTTFGALTKKDKDNKVKSPNGLALDIFNKIRTTGHISISAVTKLNVWDWNFYRAHADLEGSGSTAGHKVAPANLCYTNAEGARVTGCPTKSQSFMNWDFIAPAAKASKSKE